MRQNTRTTCIRLRTPRRAEALVKRVGERGVEVCLFGGVEQGQGKDTIQRLCDASGQRRATQARADQRVQFIRRGLLEHGRLLTHGSASPVSPVNASRSRRS